MNKKYLTYYSKQEELLNVISHGLGFLLSCIATALLVKKALVEDDTIQLISFSVFGISLMLLYAASTIYHYVQEPSLRKKLNILDHAAIFVLIAGTYTPFTLVTLQGWIGWTIFGIVWTIALVGVILKLFYTGRYEKASTIAYVGMGWVIIFAIKPLINALATEGLYWLMAGGVFYTVGAVLYSIKNLKYNHAIFHLFVLLGSFSHFMTVYYYVN